MRIVFAVMLLVLWPFHRHRPVESPTGRVTETQAPRVIVQHECERDDRGEYLFVGPDAMAGISTVSCDAAFEDWRHNYPPPALTKA